MRRRLPLVLAAVVGLVSGIGLTLAFPVEGRRLEPSAPDPAGRTRSAIVGRAPIPTLLAWTPGGLPDGYASAVGALKGVERVAEVRSGVAWVHTWRDRARPPVAAPPGLSVPVEVAAVHPARYAAFVPPTQRADVLRLRAGGAILGATGAALRGVGAGGSLMFQGGVTLRVRAVVEDELVGAHEVVVSREVGASLGIAHPRYLLVAPREHAPERRVRTSLRRLVPPGVRVRVRGPGETPFFRHGDAVLPPALLKELFGEFAAEPAAGGSLRPEPEWVRDNIRTAPVPILGRVRCHRQVLPMLRAALAEVARRGLADLLDPGDYGGCYSPRFINRDPTSALSHHAWGIAVDLNVTQNRLGAEPRMDRRIVEILERWGFTWGGRWLVPDGMHFEFLRFPLSPKG